MEGDIYLGAEMSGEGRKAELHTLGESITGRFELEAPHRVGELSTLLEKQQRKERKEECGQRHLAKSELHAESARARARVVVRIRRGLRSRDHFLGRSRMSDS